MKDLALLVADKNAQFALRGALQRSEALGIRPIEFEFRVHPGRDGGARKSGPEVLALERRRFRHALLVFDFEGSGTDLPDALALEAQLDDRLQARWSGAAKASKYFVPSMPVLSAAPGQAILNTPPARGWHGPTRCRAGCRPRGHIGLQSGRR